MRFVGKLSFITAAAAFAFLGRDRFYMAAQGRGRVAELFQWFAGHKDLERLTRNWKHVVEDGQNSRLNDGAIKLYSEAPDLGGWAKEHQTWGDMHNPLRDQIRGLIFPALEALIAEGAKTVVEIGSSNGDVLADFADRFPDVDFVGIDFSIPEKYQSISNRLNFKKGYALDMLEAGEVTGDVIFAESTLTVVGPRELEAYAAAIAEAGFKTVLILDPVTRRYSPEKYRGESRHMTFGMWGHDYRHYFGAVGYRATSFEIIPYTRHRSGKTLTMQLARLDLV